ncbi:MAG: M23 family metallopeptidase [Rikenellaceae bacterium]
MNKFNRAVSLIVKNYFTRYNLTINDAKDGKSYWQIFISPARIMSFYLVVFLLSLGVSMALIVYTPILNMLKIYSTGVDRELVMSGITRLDSLENELKVWNIYRENIVRIIGGSAPISTIDSSLMISNDIGDRSLILRSDADSALRDKLLSINKSDISNSTPPTTRSTASIELFMPVNGMITKKYNLRENFRGIEFTTTGQEPVLAVNAGRIIIVSWSPSDGSIVQIQHGNGLVTNYKGLTTTTKVAGDNIEAGEVIGTIGDIEEQESMRPLIVEFWLNGNSVDPSNYLKF